MNAEREARMKELEEIILSSEKPIAEKKLLAEYQTLYDQKSAEEKANAIILHKRKTTKRQLKVTPLDKMFSEIIRARANYICEYCGKQASKQGTHCSHFIGRRYRNTRWALDNAACLCMSCHNFMHDFPSIHKEWFTKRIGSGRLEQLEILARSGKKVDLEEVRRRLELYEK